MSNYICIISKHFKFHEDWNKQTYREAHTYDVDSSNMTQRSRSIRSLDQLIEKLSKLSYYLMGTKNCLKVT